MTFQYNSLIAFLQGNTTTKRLNSDIIAQLMNKQPSAAIYTSTNQMFDKMNNDVKPLKIQIKMILHYYHKMLK